MITAGQEMPHIITAGLPVLPLCCGLAFYNGTIMSLEPSRLGNFTFSKENK